MFINLRMCSLRLIPCTNASRLAFCTSSFVAAIFIEELRNSHSCFFFRNSGVNCPPFGLLSPCLRRAQSTTLALVPKCSAISSSVMWMLSAIHLSFAPVHL